VEAPAPATVRPSQDWWQRDMRGRGGARARGEQGRDTRGTRGEQGRDTRGIGDHGPTAARHAGANKREGERILGSGEW
jgi:hypothetical protein